MLYGWLVDEQTTIRQILKRLNAGPWLPRSGRHAWSPSTVHHILADPIYVGTAYANRYAYVPAAKPRAQRGPHTGAATCRRLRPRKQWIAIAVPALVDQEMWDRAQARLWCMDGLVGAVRRDGVGERPSPDHGCPPCLSS